MGVVHTSSGKGGCDDTQPGLDGAERLAETGIDWHTQHDLIGRHEVETAGVELENERGDTGSARGFAFLESGAVQRGVTEQPKGMETLPDVLVDLAGPVAG